MIETNIPEINVDELMEQIRAEVKKRKEGGGAFHRTVPHPNNGSPSSFYSKIDLSRICPMPDPEPFEIKDSYHAHDFLKYHGRHFVRNVYRGVLKREPDHNGLEFFLEELRGGKLTKAEVLGRLRYCREGRPKKVQVKGLFSTFLIQSSFRIPVLGYLFRIVVGIANFPAILRNLQVMEESTFTQLQQQRSNLSGALSQLEPVLERMADREELIVLKNDVHAAVEIKADREELVVLKNDVHAAVEIKADREELVVLKNDVHAAVEIKADREELVVLKNDVHAAVEIKADREELVVLKNDVHAAVEIKADREELVVLKNDVHAAVEIKADREELVVLKNDVHAAVEIKADREELVVLKNDVHAAVEIKADREELVVLKDDVHAALDNKANNEQIRDITGQIREILRQTRDHKLNILDQQRRLMFLLEEARKRLPEPICTEQIKEMLTEEDHILDAMYVSLEDRFRGTREDIKEKQRVYLPYLKDTGVGVKSLPILDLGCGRGEWLELLKEEEYQAQGVDINHVLINECIERGLDVVQGDFISFLREFHDNSVSAITAFHLIEHVPIKTLIVLLDEALRVIRPGGCVIFETPNPENLTVGACNFYVDPTHRSPLHPELTKFMIENRGFVPVSVNRLNPIGKNCNLEENDTEIVKRFNALFYGPQDYAVIGVKP